MNIPMLNWTFHYLFHLILHFGILFPQVFCSGGIFQLHIANFGFASEFPIQLCCPNSRLKYDKNQSFSNIVLFQSKRTISRQSFHSATSSPRACRPAYCQLVLKACLGVYFARQPAPQELSKCAIGQGEIIIPVTGQPKDLEDIHSGVNQLTVQGRWQPAVTIILKLFHRQIQPDGRTYEDIRITQNSIADPELLPGKSWVTRVLRVNNVFNVTATYRFQCKEGNYGKECDKTCTPRNSSHGHYTCGVNGEFICLPGWEGAFCNVAICEQGCHNGVCEGPNRCRCHSGWNGSACDVCIPYPGCVNGGCEVKLVTVSHQRKNKNFTQMQVPLTCVCHEGWAGMFCNVDQYYCQHNPGICENGGTCVNSGNGNNMEYTCLCLPGFGGTHCETPVPSCHRTGCENNGTCHIGQDSCHCPIGYFGDRCEFSRIASCEEHPCQGKNSTCIVDDSFTRHGSNHSVAESNMRSRYKCACESGRYGDFCQHEIRECDKVPDRCNGGLCVNLVDGFRCVCPVGMSGQYCQVNVDDCRDLSCQNGASCKDQVNSVVCQCKEGYEGPTCADNVDECQNAAFRGQVLCQNGGSCVDEYGSYHCVCSQGYNGYHCERNITQEERDCPTESNAFPSQPSLVCLHNGICRLVRTHVSGKESIWQQVCKCQSGYYGIRCEHELNNNSSSFLPTDNHTFLSILSLASIFILLSLFLIILFLALAVCLFRRQFCSNNSSKLKNNYNVARQRGNVLPESSLERTLILNKMKDNIYTFDLENDNDLLGATPCKSILLSSPSSLLLSRHGKATSSILLRPSKIEMGYPHLEHTYSELDYPIGGGACGGKCDKRYDTFPSPVSSRTSSMKNLNEDCYTPNGAFLYNLRKASVLSKSQNACFCRTYDPSVLQMTLESQPYDPSPNVIYSVPKLPRRHASLDQDIQDNPGPIDVRTPHSVDEQTPTNVTSLHDMQSGRIYSSTFGIPHEHLLPNA